LSALNDFLTINGMRHHQHEQVVSWSPRSLGQKNDPVLSLEHPILDVALILSATTIDLVILNTLHVGT
jgi:hypothetical protein